MTVPLADLLASRQLFRRVEADGQRKGTLVSGRIGHVVMVVDETVVVVVVVVVVGGAHASIPVTGSAMCSNMLASRLLMWASAAE